MGVQKILVLHKPLGKTPLILLDEFRLRHPEYADVKIGYAGRLDPMAEGLVLYMVGEENKEREKYLGMDKEYEIEILFGVETESYDVLGLIRQSKVYESEEVSEQVKNVLTQFEGEIDQAFPPYSSKPFNGKPLYYWARRGELEGVELPKEKRKIYSIEEVERKLLEKSKLQEIIIDKLSYVEGNFNQESIIKGWQEFFAKTTQESWLCVTLQVKCSSGTYMRSLAHEIGKAVGTGACALSIIRSRIGDYNEPMQPTYSTPNQSL